MYLMHMLMLPAVFVLLSPLLPVLLTIIHSSRHLLLKYRDLPTDRKTPVREIHRRMKRLQSFMAD